MEQKKEDKKEEESIRNKVIRILGDKYSEFSRQLSNHRGKVPPQYQPEFYSLYEELRKKEHQDKELPNVDNLKNQIDEKQKSIEELTDTLKRLQAEFENYKKWNAKEKIDFAKYANAGIIAEMLPVLDSFEIALKNTADKEKFVEGMKMIYAQLYSALEAEGLRPINTTGEKFDPYKHEVLLKEESDKPEGTILEEFQKGYMLNDKVLRFSKVKVSGK